MIEDQHTEISSAELVMNNLKKKFIKIPFATAPKRTKYLGINLTKEMQDLYIENYKTLFKGLREDLNKWKVIPCLWIGRLNNVKITIFLKFIYRFNEISIKIPTAFLAAMDKLILKFIWNRKGPQIAKLENEQS